MEIVLLSKNSSGASSTSDIQAMQSGLKKSGRWFAGMSVVYRAGQDRSGNFSNWGDVVVLADSRETADKFNERQREIELESGAEK